MSFFSSIVKNVKEFYSEINGATLTGAIDVIVVGQEDGTFKCSPFHVRFGKMGVLKAKEKIVDLEVNGEPVEIQMKLDDTGAAFFVEEVDHTDDSWQVDLETSPIPGQMDFDWKTRKIEKLEPNTILKESELKHSEQKLLKCFDLNNDPDKKLVEDGNLKVKVNKKKIRKNINCEIGSKGGFIENILENNSCTDDMFDMEDINDAGPDDEADWPEYDLSCVPKEISRRREEYSSVKEHSHENTFIDSLDGRMVPVKFQPKSVSSGFHYFPVPPVSKDEKHPPLDWELYDLHDPEGQNVWRWGELPKVAMMDEVNNTTNISDDIMDKKQSWFGSWSAAKSNANEETVGVYLEDIADNPDLLEEYLGSKKTEKVDPLETSPIKEDPKLINLNIEQDKNENDMDLETEKAAVRLDSGCPTNIHYDSDLSSLLSRYLPDLAVSLCGGLSDGQITPELFQLNILDYSQFLEKVRAGPGSLLADHNLVIRVHEKYLSWDKAAPILLSVLLFKQPIAGEVISEILTDCLNANVNTSVGDVSDMNREDKKSWLGWFGGESKEDDDNIKKRNPDNAFPNDHKETESTIPTCKESNSISGKYPEKRKLFHKTLRLSSEKLADLNLKSGRNEIEFSVTTAFQGTSRCKCHIYLWHHSDKVVISDIDGTITKSDVLGHILPVIGRDWAQSGVAHLFSKIQNNGYHIMYLTARAIGQASTTKDYLQSLKQGDVCLPDGPLFLNPDSLVNAFKREVIDRNPEEFKIRCLKDIQSLFEDKNPFFAGYGNRPNDAFAYRAVGIPVSRIFTINPAGQLKHELTQNFQTSYESQSMEVDYYFPNLLSVQHIKNQLKSFPRKQSIYFDASDFLTIKDKSKASEAPENLSDTEEQVRPFRVRSGTDISDSVNAARYKLKMKKNADKNKHDPSKVSLDEANSMPIGLDQAGGEETRILKTQEGFTMNRITIAVREESLFIEG